ncbi:replication protein A 70 kDa DNA-binding subunit B [Tanacetum coccineum]|uniref:Replication protein A 70 kDa DNA-binding subunit B n=1 Tax=Tanacetum coccineum TaxID=301880 RepID=A0ABQ5DMH7_9ASTR
MEINITQLCDLDPMLDDARILACVISIWKSHPKQRPNEVWSLDAVLQDQMVIEFKPQLETTISRSSNQYWMKEHVTESVTLVSVKIAETFHYVIGTIVSISDAIPFNYDGVDKIRRTVILEDYEGAQLEYPFFDSWSDKFSKLYDEKDKSGIVVMILQLCKVKYFNEKPSVTPTMYSTKLYINNDIPEIAAFRKRYSEKEGFDPKNHSIVQFTSVKKEVTVEDFFRGRQNDDRVTAAVEDEEKDEIKDYYDCRYLSSCEAVWRIFRFDIHHRYPAVERLPFHLPNQQFVVFDPSESIDFQLDKVSANTSKFLALMDRNKTDVQARNLLFKVIVRVIDATGSASLLLFDDLVFKLSDEQCVHLIRQHGENYDDYFSEELNVLVGKRLLFRFHYTDDHINNNNHVYQVKMLSQDEAMITMFKKDFILEQTPVPSNANSSRFTNVDSIPFKLDETPKSSYVATKGNASHVDGEHSSMEIESDAGGFGSGKRIFIDLDAYDEEEAQAK